MLRPSLQGKYLLGRCMAVAGLAVLLPLLALVALAVLASSPGPVLFRQRRVGAGGHEFTMLKFRTMWQEGALCAPLAIVGAGMAPGGVEGVDRRTTVGRLLRRTSLDELPQLWNVARGDMALVGPRPERPEYVERFSRDVPGYDARHRQRPGLTGLAQVQGSRGRTPVAERAALDNAYIEGWSLALDVRILARTAGAVLRGAE
jgi:lipopolysaccharide/colanic/teichoic acid biosynthesis glycosyltransferase